MPTDCILEQLQFGGFDGRKVVAVYDGGAITGDGGALLLRETDRAINLFERVADCFVDRRNLHCSVHDVRTLVAQRVTALALGCEDVDNHDTLRHDPVLAQLSRSLASKRRRSDIDASAGAQQEVEQITTRIRWSWPSVRIILRADSGFARDSLMDCETNKVDYVFGLARNKRLKDTIAPTLQKACLACCKSGEPVRQSDETTKLQKLPGVPLTLTL